MSAVGRELSLSCQMFAMRNFVVRGSTILKNAQVVIVLCSLLEFLVFHEIGKPKWPTDHSAVVAQRLPMCWLRAEYALPGQSAAGLGACPDCRRSGQNVLPRGYLQRSEEHTSELQSLTNIVCR